MKIMPDKIDEVNFSLAIGEIENLVSFCDKREFDAGEALERIAKAEKVLADIKAAIVRRAGGKCPCEALKMDGNACDGCADFK